MPISSPNTIIACHECDALQELPPGEDSARMYCPRCGTLVRRRIANSIDKTLAWTATGLILFIVANIFPFMGLNAHGQIQDSTLISSSLGLYKSSQPVLASLVLLTTIIFPLLDLLGMLFILLSVKLSVRTPFLRPSFIFLQQARPWGMVEIFMLGVMVALVKLSDLATVVPGIALYAFSALIFILAAISYTFDPEEVWSKLSELSQ